MKVSFSYSTGEVVNLPVVSVLPSHIAGYEWLEIDQGHTVKIFSTYEPNVENRPFTIEKINTVYRTDSITNLQVDPPGEHHVVYGTGDEIWYNMVGSEMVV